MKKEHIQYLVCPLCKGDLVLRHIHQERGGSVETGILSCCRCSGEYNIVRHIPRFVSIDNYAKSFGLEWTLHARTQYDSYTGTNASETRFFQQTRWPRNLNGQIILEAGSGSGRFTEQAASTGAMVVSMDLSNAVEANYALNGSKENVCIVQADIYKMPFRENFFDKLFCLGVLQHTPHVEQAFMQLPRYLKPEGNLVIDIYAKEPAIQKLLSTKYWLRPVTRRLLPERLYAACKSYIAFMWPLAKYITKIPCIGKRLVWRLLIQDYSGAFNFSEEILKEWAVLELFDTLSPWYDSPQSLVTVKQWFRDAPLNDAEVCLKEMHIEGRGTKPR